MAITLSSFISSSISITILIGILFLILKKQTLMSRFGLGCIYFLVLLILLRGFIPVEFYSIPLTRSIYSYHILPWLNTSIKQNLFILGAFAITPLTILYIIWGIGALLYLWHTFQGYFNLRKFYTSIPNLTDYKIKKIFNTAQNDLCIKNNSKFKIILTDTFDTPAISGIRKPVIILPTVPYTEKELYYVFSHELLHYKHKDFLFKLLLDILIAIHWWNPLLSKFLFPVVNQIQELLVDYHLTKTLDKDQKALYMNALTKTLRYKQEKQQLTKPASSKQTYALMDTHTKTDILQRLQYIIQKPIQQISIWGIFICLCLFVATFTVVFEPSYVETKNRVDEDGNPTYLDIEGETYYIKNGNSYDLYMENQYMCTTPEIFEDLGDIPIYNNPTEVPHK